MKRHLLILALLAGLGLRLFGLSHDLAEGYIYHPDTPKQINAVERYLDGIYYTHYGLSDYDGYPLFNSHLVEFVVRAIRPVVNSTASLLGVPYEGTWPETMALYWVTRLFNVFLATLLIWIVYRIGRGSFDERTGLLAAWFLALSPVDMSCAHLETGDTTAGFFATVCVLFALRIYRRGTNLDYILAAFFGMCAFAAKYNAGIAMVAPMAAHVLRQERWYDVFDAEAMTKLTVFVAAAIGSLYLTIPTLLTHPGQVPQEMLQFFRHVSSGKRLSAELREGGIAARFFFSMERNGPILVHILSPALIVVSLAGLWKVIRWNRTYVILYSLPLVYFFLGVSLRPLSHPIYHTMMTPVLFVICAALLCGLSSLPPPRRRLAAIVSALVIVASAGHLLNESAEEGFYYWHRDTRRMAEKWTRENVPASFHPIINRYGFNLDDFGDPAAGPAGFLYVSSSIGRRAIPDGLTHVKDFALEKDPLPFFRNPDLALYTMTHALRDGFQLPVHQRAPARTGNELVFNGPEFIRSEKLFYLNEERLLRRIYVETAPLAESILVLKNSVVPAVVDVSFAGESFRVALRAGESRVLSVPRPSASFPCEEGKYFYRLKAGAHHGRVRMTLATTPLERALALDHAGFHQEAFPLLAAAAREGKHPALAAQALIAALLGGVEPEAGLRDELAALAAPLAEEWPAWKVAEQFGISTEYLQALDFLVYEAEDVPHAGLATIRDMHSVNRMTLGPDPKGTNTGSVVGLASMLLEPGAYRLGLDVRPEREGETVMNVTMTLAEHGAVSLDQDAGATFRRSVHSVSLTNMYRFESAVIPFEVPAGGNPLSLSLRDRGIAAVHIDRLVIMPDTEATLRGLGEIVQLLAGTKLPVDVTTTLAYQPLLALGDRRAATNDADGALACYRAAARLCPELAAPWQRMSAVADRVASSSLADIRKELRAFEKEAAQREFHATPVLFSNGVRLLGYRISTRRMHRDEPFGLNLYWAVEKPDVEARSLAVWVHMVDGDGDVRFQLDHDFANDLERNPDMKERVPQFQTVAVPTRARLGQYKIRVGLCGAGGGDRVKVKETELERRNGGVVLPEEIKVDF